MKQHEEHLLGPGLPAAYAYELMEEAVSRYSEPWRHHHVVEHLGDVLGYLVENIDQLERPRPTLWAGIWHDSIYVPQAPPGVNEELSAQLGEASMRPFLSKDEIGLMGHYVRQTAEHAWDGEDGDLALLLDVDLKILGAPPEEFDDYDANIRREYHFVDPEVYRLARIGILNGFYDQDRIFITDTAHGQFEEQAKANLERAIKRLETGWQS